MDEMNIVPIYRQGIGEIKNGIEIGISDFCKKNVYNNSRCIEFYKSIYMDKAGFYTCPYGFVAYVFKDEESSIFIFTGCRVKEAYNPKLADPKVKNSTWSDLKNTVITKNQMEIYAELYLEYNNGISKYEKHKKFVEEIFHDMRKFNSQMKANAENIFTKSRSKKKLDIILPYTKNLNAACNFMTLRLNCYDFAYNELLMGETQKTSYNLFKVFDKVRMCLSDQQLKKNCHITLNSAPNFMDIMAHDCIELLPYIFLDNALKYSKENESIEVNFFESRTNSKIKIKSYSLNVSDDELDKICNSGFRGSLAIKKTSEGMGIGLYTAKKICDLHDMDMKISVTNRTLEKNDVFCNFEIEVVINT